MVTEVEKAYFAGFIDGEGSFDANERDYMKSDRRRGHREGYKYHYHRFDAAVQVKNTNRVVLDDLKAAYGGTVRGPYQYANQPNTKPYYVWSRYVGPNRLQILDDLQPYLRIKARLAELVRALVTSSSMDEKGRIKEVIVALNQRGKLKGRQLPLTQSVASSTIVAREL